MNAFLLRVLAALLLFGAPIPGHAQNTHAADAALQLQGRTAKVTRLDTLPFVQNEFTGRFRFDSAANPKLTELRERHGLEQVIASGNDEFEKQVLLMDWVHNRFRKFGQPSTRASGALQILEGIENGHTFFCTQYAQLFASAAASLGWVDRVLALRRHQDVGRDGSSEHSTTEIWSNQHRKWVMLDPTSNLYLEKEGVPLNAYEIRQEWFYRDGKNLVFVIGKEQRRYRKSDLPIHLKTFPDFGELAVAPDELDKYGFIGYIPNTDLMDSGFDYGGMFITKDQLCDGTQWHKRTNPKNPATDPYFPIDQAAIQLTPAGADLAVTLQTFCPNFKAFQISLNNGEWQQTAETNLWKLRPGSNQLRARTVNTLGVIGPVSTIEVDVE